MPSTSGVRLSTPLGEVHVTARCDGGSTAAVSIRADGPPPLNRMPKGMRIEGGALLIVEAMLAAGAGLELSLVLRSARPMPDADPTCGEHLDCVVVSTDGMHLALAARDQEWMAAHQPDAAGYDVTLMRRGLDITAQSRTAGARITIPLALAWASGPDPLSVWYGADAILPA